ncbi:MAG: PD-(D/E)XK nuclease family protein [Vulcanimicrobiota bacterium]
MPLSFSATTIKSWFQYRCDRKTRYETMSRDEREAIPILKDDQKDSWAELGNDFELAVVRRLARESKVLTPKAGEQNLGQRITAAFLRGQNDCEFAHQAVLFGGPSLRQQLSSDDQIIFRHCYPDLLQWVDGAIRIIDVKATQVATYFHKAQVAFYSHLLQGMLKDMGVEARVDEVGEIWHLRRGEDGADGLYDRLEFKLKSYENLVRDFFERTVPRLQEQVVEPGRDETFFHLYYKCEQCGYLPHCRRAIEREAAKNDVSAVPGMSHEAKRALEKLGIHTVGGLARAQGIRNQKLDSWSLKRQAELLRLRAETLVNGQPKILEERYTYLMPPRIDVGLYLVVDSDPMQGNLVTLGYLLDWQGEVQYATALLPKGQPAEEIRALKQVLGKLVLDLRRLHEHNQRLPEAQRLYAHILLYEPSEAKDLQRAVGRHLNDPDIRTGLLDLVRLFPPEEVIPEPGYRGYHHLPATALRTVMEQLYLLPVTVSYDLRQVTQALTAVGLSEAYEPSQAFKRDFSTRLSIEVLRKLRDGHRGMRDIEDDLRIRLASLRHLARWVLEQNAAAASPFLRLRKQPFAFQAEFNPLGREDLEILRAYELLAEKSGMLNALISLAQPWEARRDAMKCFAQLRLESHREGKPWARFRFRVPTESRDAELGPDDINLVLTNNDPDILLDPTRWEPFQIQLDPVDSNTQVRARMWAAKYGSAEMQHLLLDNPEDQWFIDRSFRDFNTERVVEFLEMLGDQA